MSFTFISNSPTSAATRTVTAKDRLRIRSQVMRSSWAEKKRRNDLNVSVRETSGWRKRKTVRWDEGVEDKEEGRRRQASESKAEIVRKYVGSGRGVRIEVEKKTAATCCEETYITLDRRRDSVVYITPPDSLAGDVDDEEESLETTSKPTFFHPITSSFGVDPFTGGVVDLNPQIGHYLHYYLNVVVPLLHPFSIQCTLLYRNLVSYLSSSPLVLFSTLSIAALRVDNYSNRFSDLLSFWRTKSIEPGVPVPHSFRFKAAALHHLRLAVSGKTETSLHEKIFALVNIVSYDSLVARTTEAEMHLQGLYLMLRRCCSHRAIAGQTTITAADQYAFDDVLSEGFCRLLWPISWEFQKVREIVALHSTFPPLIGMAYSGNRWDIFSRSEHHFVDTIRGTGLPYYLSNRSERSEVLKVILGNETVENIGLALPAIKWANAAPGSKPSEELDEAKIGLSRALHYSPVAISEQRSEDRISAQTQDQSNGIPSKPDGFKPTCWRIGCDGRRFEPRARGHTVLDQAIEALMVHDSWGFAVCK